MSDDFGHFPEPGGHFHKVMALHEEPSLEWELLSKQIPFLTRGWFELARLSQEDRVEFTGDYWLSKLPLLASNGDRIETALARFFSEIEDIGIFATQVQEGLPFDVHMIYCLKESAGFFHGSVPAQTHNIEALKRQFYSVSFPPDYVAFLEIHDGFCKYTDTGIIKTKEMARIYQKFQELLEGEVLFAANGQVINPVRLIPFYEAEALHCYQCFYADWYPDDEMGNLYFSQNEKVISNFQDEMHLEDNLAFATFLDWLTIYLEDFV